MDIQKKNLIIIGGVHKAATTSLYEYFIKHPEVCAGEKKEIHYYTPLRYGNELKDFHTYEDQFTECTDRAYLIDASPSYLYGKKEIALKIKGDLENVKIIFILRDPVQRFISFYNFIKSDFRLEKNESFMDFLNKSYTYKDSEDKDDVYYRAFREGCYADYLKDWLEMYGDNVKIIFFDDLKNDSQKIMKNLSDWIGLESSIYNDTSIFTITNKTQASKHKGLFKMASTINMKFENFWRKNKGLKNFLKSLYFKINGSDYKESINAHDKKILNDYYKPYNLDLYKLLKKYHYDDLPSWLDES